jgi:hypothetical protein
LTYGVEHVTHKRGSPVTLVSCVLVVLIVDIAA